MRLHHANFADSSSFGATAVLDGGRALGSNFGLSAGRPLAGTHRGQVAQLVEQRIENPRVDGSIPSLATTSKWCIPITWFTFHSGHMVNTVSGAKGFGPGSTRS